MLLISTIVGLFYDVRSPILVTETYFEVLVSEKINPNLTILVIVSICCVICTVYGTLILYWVYNCKIALSINYFTLLNYAYCLGSLGTLFILLSTFIFVLDDFIYSTFLFNYVLLIITYWLLGINISTPFYPVPIETYEPGLLFIYLVVFGNLFY